MGYSSYSDDFYNSRVTDRAAAGVSAFDYSAKVTSGRTTYAVHDSLNIKGKIRESRDSKEHPNSTAIAVMFDVTGSMCGIPFVLQYKLPSLMSLLLRKAYIEDPQVLFGAVGDFFADRIPLQVGQFESGIEMDDNMNNIVLEGGGGGQNTESYQDALWYFANRTSCDCYEKRGKKGYLFMIGDEYPFKKVTKAELDEIFGVPAEKDVSLKEVVEAVKEKWTVFFLIPNGSSNYSDPRLNGSVNYSDPRLKECWVSLFGGENVIMVDHPEAMCETIGIAIGLCEGTCDAEGIAKDLKDVGAGKHVVHAVTAGLDGLAKSTALAKTGTGDLPEKEGRSALVERL